MDTLQKEVLDLHHEHLVTSLRTDDVIDGLLRENVISKYDYDQLKRTEAQGSKALNRLLLLTLQRGNNSDTFPAFQRSLLDSGQGELHDLLKNCEMDLLEAVLTDRLQRSLDGASSLRGSLYRTSNHEPRTAHLREEDSLDLDPAIRDLLLHNGDTDSNPHLLQTPQSPLPVQSKTSSPASKNRSQTSSTRRGSSSRKPDSSSSAALKQEEESKENSPPSSQNPESEDPKVKELEQEVQELRRSYGKMESELKREIERLEKEKKERERGGGGKKKEGGCAVM